MIVGGLAATLAVGACVAAPGGGDIEPRYVAVHNTLAAMGLSEIGPILRGSLAPGREDRLRVDLRAQCTTIVALGGPGVRDLDVSLVDPAGQPVAHDVSKDPEATLRACVDAAGSYTLIVKMAAGGGNYRVATWGGGGSESGIGGTAQSAPAASLALGTCESPLPLGAGTLTASTARAVEGENEGSCGTSSGKELVYKLELPGRQRVTLDVSPRFDSVLYVRKDDCGEPDAEVACNDDAPNQKRSKIDAVFEPGTYYVFVDGYGNEAGTFTMHTTVADVPTLADVCRRATPLVAGGTVTHSTSGTFDWANGACGDGAKGPDTVFKFDVDRRERVRLVERSGDFSPILHVRRQCADEASEIACSDSGANDHEASVVLVLDPGSYAVFADSLEHDADGEFTLSSEIAPDQGSGSPGDGCGDATPLAKNDPDVEGDTFAAKDDVAGRCSGQGAGDLVYRVEVPRRSRVSAKFRSEEGEHIFSIMRGCADRSTEVACEREIEQVLSPGTYFLAVDGAGAGATGRFTFDWSARDIAAQEAACRSVVSLSAGHTVRGSTAGAADKFTTTCAGELSAQGAPDHVYRMVLPGQTHVRLSLTTSGWDGVLVVRASCLDGAGAAGSPRASELVCSTGTSDAAAHVDATLPAGTYFVIVDGRGAANEGGYTLEYR